MATQLHPYSAIADGHPLDPYTGVAFEYEMSINSIHCAVSAASVITFHDGADATAPEVARFQSAGASTGNAFIGRTGELPIRSKLYVKFVSGAGKVFIYSK